MSKTEESNRAIIIKKNLIESNYAMHNRRLTDEHLWRQI